MSRFEKNGFVYGQNVLEDSDAQIIEHADKILAQSKMMAENPAIINDYIEFVIECKKSEYQWTVTAKQERSWREYLNKYVPMAVQYNSRFPASHFVAENGTFCTISMTFDGVAKTTFTPLKPRDGIVNDALSQRAAILYQALL